MIKRFKQTNRENNQLAVATQLISERAAYGLETPLSRTTKQFQHKQNTVTFMEAGFIAGLLYQRRHQFYLSVLNKLATQCNIHATVGDLISVFFLHMQVPHRHNLYVRYVDEKGFVSCLQNHHLKKKKITQPLNLVQVFNLWWWIYFLFKSRVAALNIDLSRHS